MSDMALLARYPCLCQHGGVRARGVKPVPVWYPSTPPLNAPPTRRDRAGPTAHPAARGMAHAPPSSDSVGGEVCHALPSSTTVGMAGDVSGEGAPTPPRRLRVLLGVSGSVATVKWATLVNALSRQAEVAVVATKAAEHFLHDVAKAYNPAEYAAAMASGVKVYVDEDEWRSYHSVREDAVVHIELRRWADVFLLAPASANTLAKLAGGLCDNLLTSVARAWQLPRGSGVGKPFLVAPAMNTGMWDHPLTARHLDTLASFGVTIIPPVTKVLACGDTGIGAMAPVDVILAAVLSATARTG